jgi:hypothetical protein
MAADGRGGAARTAGPAAAAPAPGADAATAQVHAGDEITHIFADIMQEMQQPGAAGVAAPPAPANATLKRKGDAVPLPSAGGPTAPPTKAKPIPMASLTTSFKIDNGTAPAKPRTARKTRKAAERVRPAVSATERKCHAHFETWRQARRPAPADFGEALRLYLEDLYTHQGAPAVVYAFNRLLHYYRRLEGIELLNLHGVYAVFTRANSSLSSSASFNGDDPFVTLSPFDFDASGAPI